MKVIRDYEKLRLDTSSDQIIKEFATYIDIPSIQAAIYKLTNLQLSFQFQYMRELLRIIREKLENIVIYIEDELGYEIDERMKGILTTAENLEEAVEALEDYDSDDDSSTREMPDQREVEERTIEVKNAIDLILPPEIIVAIADAGKKGAEEVAKDSGKTVTTVATVVTEAPKETTKEAVEETVKTAAQETVEAVSHAGSGAAIDTIIDAILGGASDINVAGVVSILATGGAAAGAATAAAAAATGTAALVAAGEVGIIGAGLAGLGAHGVVGAGGAAIVAGGATIAGGAAAGGLLGLGIAGGAILINEVGKVLEEQERTHLAEAIEHAKEAVEEAIRDGKSATEAQWAGIEALGPSSPGAPNTTGYTMETLGIDPTDIYGLLGDYANEQAETANSGSSTNGSSTNGSSTDGYGTNDNSNDLTPAGQDEGDCDEGDCSEGDCGDGDCDEGNEGCAGASDIW